MARNFKYSLKQTAVVWTASLGYDINGRPTIVSSEGEEIRCRWEDGVEHTYGPMSETSKFDAIVYVDTEVPIGSLLWKGKLEDWPGSDIDVEDVRLMKVMEVELVPSLKNRFNLRCLRLLRYTDTLAGTP